LLLFGIHDYIVFISRSDTSLYLQHLAQIPSCHFLDALTDSNVVLSTSSHEFVHGLIDLSLGQLNTVLNCSGKILDLLWT